MTSVDTRVAHCNTQLNSLNRGFLSSPFKTKLTTAFPWLKVGSVGLLAAGMVGASAYFNGLFGLTTSGIALGVAAVCFDLLKPVFHASKGWTVAAYVATAMSLVAAFSYQTINKAQLTAQHEVSTQHKTDARDAYKRALETRTLAKAELATLSQTRTIGATQSEIRSILAIPGVECGAPKGSRQYGPISKRWCPQVEVLRSGLAVAQRRAELLAIVNAKIEAPEPTTVQTIKDVAAPSESFTGLLAALGIMTTADFIAGLSVLFYVIGLEIGSSRALVLVRQICGPAIASTKALDLSPVEYAEKPEDTGVDSDLDDGGQGPGNCVHEVVPLIPRRGRKVSGREDIAARVVDTLKSHGGEFAGGVRKLAEQIGGRKSTVHNAVKELVEAGALIQGRGSLKLA